MTPFLAVKDVSVTYGNSDDESVVALRTVSFEVKANTVLGIAGETGAGKSTLARAIVALEPLSQGQIWFEGQCVASSDKRNALSGEALRQARQHFQILFQDPDSSLSPRMTIQDIVAEGALAHGIWRRAEAGKRVDELLTSLHLSPALMSRFPHELSGGERRRVALARVLALQPRLLVLDEPTAGLDATNVDDVLSLLIEIGNRSGVGLIVISHDLSVLKELAQEILVMRMGQVVEQAPANQFFAAPTSAYSRALLSAAAGDKAWIEPQEEHE